MGNQALPTSSSQSQPQNPQVSQETCAARPVRSQSKACTDPIVGAILSGWRYDISNISPEMRTDYEQHLAECGHCHHRQTVSRTIDVLLISVSSLSILAFLLMTVVLHRIEMLTHISNVHLYLHRTPITISLEVVAIAGLIISMALWVLVAIATPIPGYMSNVAQERIPTIWQRFARRHA